MARRVDTDCLQNNTHLESKQSITVRLALATLDLLY